MMYQHTIDECIDRAETELRTLRKYHRIEDAAHVQRRIESLKRIRKHAPKARFNPSMETAKVFKPASSLDYDEYMRTMIKSPI